MKYYGIKTPDRHNGKNSSYIWWITNSEHTSWVNFFSYSDREGNYNSSRTPMAEAKDAYEAIGYKCVELKLIEVDSEDKA